MDAANLLPKQRDGAAILQWGASQRGGGPPIIPDYTVLIGGIEPLYDHLRRTPFSHTHADLLVWDDVRCEGVGARGHAFMGPRTKKRGRRIGPGYGCRASIDADHVRCPHWDGNGIAQQCIRRLARRSFVCKRPFGKLSQWPKEIPLLSKNRPSPHCRRPRNDAKRKRCIEGQRWGWSADRPHGTARDHRTGNRGSWPQLQALNHIDVSQMTSLADVFFRSDFNGDISLWDTSGVTSLENTFAGSQFNGDISQWDTSRVTF